jgi:uncharacterized OsmC-like protein
MVLTMAAVAEHKGIGLKDLSVSVRARTDFDGRSAVTRFSSELGLGEELTARELRILFNSARTCEVHKMLQGEVSFVEYLVNDAPAFSPRQEEE